MPEPHDYLWNHRSDIVRRWEKRVRERLALKEMDPTELRDEIPHFVEKILGDMARTAGASLPDGNFYAVEHGEQRLRLGFDVGLVVREYGFLVECFLEVAGEGGLELSTREMLLLFRSVNAGIEAAVSEHSRQRHDDLRRQAAEQSAFFSHELRNPMSAAGMAVSLLRRGVNISGPRPLDVLERSLKRLQVLVDDQLIELRTRSGIDLRRERVVLFELLDDALAESALHAQDRGVAVALECAPGAMVDADPKLLRSAVTNLVRNAVKFTDAGGHVVVRASENGGRLQIEIEDRCGGLEPGLIEKLMNPFVQVGKDRSGFGLGLAIARQAIEAHQGTLNIRNLPGTGCVFVLDLPILATAAEGGATAPGA